MTADGGSPVKEQTRTTSTVPISTVKDTDKDEMSRFLDNQTLRTNPFGENLSGEYAYRRAERITSAIYLVTSHIEEDEPACRSIRRGSLQLLHRVLALRAELRAPSSENVRNVQASIRELISLIRILGISGRVSPQNTQLLVDALDELGNLLTTSQRSTLAEAVPLTRADFTPHTESSLAQRTTAARGRVSNSRKIRQSRKGLAPSERSVSLKDTDTVGSKKDEAVSRTGRIMDILRTGMLLGIKDIASNLPEYSEKMIQRDLATLVQENMVKKTGAKRWSKYEIVR